MRAEHSERKGHREQLQGRFQGQKEGQYDCSTVSESGEEGQREDREGERRSSQTVRREGRSWCPCRRAEKLNLHSEGRGMITLAALLSTD